MSRIIAGSAKGRRIATPKGKRTRPTTDRVREALFSALASWFGVATWAASEHLVGIATLDLFGGSGAIGLEAASRGSSRVVIVESDGSTSRLIRSNAKDAGLLAEVVTGRLPGALKGISGPFDLVIADPPYDLPEPQVTDVLAGLVTGNLLAPKALVVVERAKRSGPPLWPAAFTDTWQREYGETSLHFGATN